MTNYYQKMIEVINEAGMEARNAHPALASARIEQAVQMAVFAEVEQLKRIADALERLASVVGPLHDADNSPPVFWNCQAK